MSQPPNQSRNRKSIRYDGYDYTSPGSYSITICTHKGKSMFGQIVDSTMILNPLGEIANQCCIDFGEKHPLIRLDIHQIMPNHAHILFTILERATAAPSEPKARKFGDAIAGSVSSYMGGYKNAVTQRAKNQGLIPGPPLWHGRFWDRIVRNEIEFERHRNYIETNPARWLQDQLHPAAPPNKFNSEWRNE